MWKLFKSYSLSNPIILFILKAFGLYLLWYLLYELWLNPLDYADLFVIDKIIVQSTWGLNLLGYNLIPDEIYDTSYRTVGLDGTHGLWIGDNCNGLNLFALFTGFIIAYPGKIIKKLWYIPLGIITIHLLNVIRVVLLSIILLEAPESLHFNHTYTFTTIIYTYIFLLWYMWANKLSKQ